MSSSTNLLSTAMEAQSPNLVSPQTDDVESKMRRNLGLGGTSGNGSAPSSANDPLKAARQAIRSQVTAREFAERQLAQAQGTIQDLRTKLRHVHQERESAIATAQSAMAASDTAERTMRAAEKVLAAERATRVRTEGMLRDAEATIRDLREKLATANQTIHTMRAEPDARQQVDQEVVQPTTAATAAKEITIRAVHQEAAAPMMRRPRGRPRKAVAALEVMTPASPKDAPVPTPRRSVGRPRKLAVVPASQSYSKATNTADRRKAAKPVTPVEIFDSEPVQWWLPGWRGR
jgi:hypothetical protein